jgi:hypothetical protein
VGLDTLRRSGKTSADPWKGAARAVISQLVAVTSFVAALLLAAAGLVKLVRPLPTARALYAAGLPGASWLARGIGLAELAVGCWFLAAPSAASGFALAAIYLLFAGFVTFLLTARPEAASCGCAGARDVPPSWIHAALNLTAGAAGVAAALDRPASFGRSLADLQLVAVPYLIGVGTATVLAVVAVTDLPPAMWAFRRPPGHPVETDRDRHGRADGALAASGIGPGHASLWPGADPAEIEAANGPDPADA